MPARRPAGRGRGGEKIGKNIISFKKKQKYWPDKQLSICTFTFEDSYDDSKKNKTFWKDAIHQQSAVCEVTVLLVNPTGEEYTLIE